MVRKPRFALIALSFTAWRTWGMTSAYDLGKVYAICSP
jgi:hypothetical protein